MLCFKKTVTARSVNVSLWFALMLIMIRVPEIDLSLARQNVRFMNLQPFAGQLRFLLDISL